MDSGQSLSLFRWNTNDTTRISQLQRATMRHGSRSWNISQDGGHEGKIQTEKKTVSRRLNQQTTSIFWYDELKWSENENENENAYLPNKCIQTTCFVLLSLIYYTTIATWFYSLKLIWIRCLCFFLKHAPVILYKGFITLWSCDNATSMFNRKNWISQTPVLFYWRPFVCPSVCPHSNWKTADQLIYLLCIIVGIFVMAPLKVIKFWWHFVKSSNVEN